MAQCKLQKEDSENDLKQTLMISSVDVKRNDIRATIAAIKVSNSLNIFNNRKTLVQM